MPAETPAIDAELERVAAMLPAPVDVLRSLGPGRPWFVRYGPRSAVLRRSDPARLRQMGFTPDGARASIEWLHAFLRDLAATRFVAPAPVADLAGASLIAVAGALWELLSFVDGRPLGWGDEREVAECGRLLARYHESASRTGPRPQRPGALPLDACRPAHPEARRIRAAFERELAEIDHAHAPRAVIHGDATNANVVVDERGGYRLVDFTIGYIDVVLADIASALWRNGRTGPNETNYDPGRAATFVRAYADVRELPRSSATAIVVYMKGRGLQLQHRLELRRGEDPTVMARLLSVDAQQRELEEALAAR